MATVRDFVRKNSTEAPGPAHPCDAPGLGPLEFIQAVYRDLHLPMSIRIDAARGLLPFTEPRPASSFPPRCTIVIGGLGPGDHGSGTEDPEQINSDLQSFPLRRPTSHQPPSGATGPSNIEMTSYPPYLENIIQTLAGEA